MLGKSIAKGEHSAILSTFIKLPFVIKIFVLSVLEWSSKTGFTVLVFVLQRLLRCNYTEFIKRVGSQR